MNMTTDEELTKIFSKHCNNELIKKSSITFDDDIIKKNIKEIEEFRRNNLLKEQKHFNIEDEDKDEIFKLQSNDKKEKKNKKEDYFNNILQETLTNDNLYCSYLDYFDKIWMNNNSKGKEITEGKSLSCAGCFNIVSYNSHALKYLTNMYITSSLVNCYMDFLEIYKWDDFIYLLQSNRPADKNSKIFSNRQLKELGLDEEYKDKTEFVAIKCKNCLNVIGVFNSQDNKYIMFNSFN